MISQLEKKIAFRYLKTRKKDGFLNVISVFSFIGISLGVAVLIIVMSVMNGFRSELVNKIVGFNSHVIIQSNNITEDFKLVDTDPINLLNKMYIAWCKKEKFDEILSADEMLLSGQVQMPYQSYWLRRFIEIWNRVEDIESQRYWKRKQKIVN